jgi:hypothetical protein
MKKFMLLFSMLVSFATAAHAQRSVSVIASEGVLELINGSAVTVNYNIDCFDVVTGTNLLTSNTNLTLSPKQSVKYESSGSCAGGAQPEYKFSQGVIACPGSGDWTAVASACHANSPRCTYNQIVAKGITSFQGIQVNKRYAFEFGADFYMTYDNWTKNYLQTISGKKSNQGYTYFDTGKNTQNYRCSSTASGGIQHCMSQTTTSTYQVSGSLCCPTNNGFKSCKVTILSSTPTAGFLQSPQFKGGASF